VLNFSILGTSKLFQASNCELIMYLSVIKNFRRRPQWPRGLRHELSSTAQTLGSCVRIPLGACMSVCIYAVCAGSGLAMG
jgi:hypothetical protein